MKNGLPDGSNRDSGPAEVDSARLVRRHIRFGWWSLLAFAALGVALESLHALKVGWYVDEADVTRRTLWRLAHAHGTLLSLVHIVFGVTLALQHAKGRWPRFASPCLLGASVLMPAGFFLGGLYTYGGDPGLGIFLLPVGAVLLIAALLVVALRVTGSIGSTGSRAPARSAGEDAE